VKTASAYKSLCQDDKRFLLGTAQEVDMLVAKPKKMDYFRKQLRDYGEKWKACKDVYDADRKGKWQPSMGKPGKPFMFEAPWVKERGEPFTLNFGPRCGDIQGERGAYAFLAVIHDRVLPNCPSIAKGILPEQLASKIWRNLVTGATLETPFPNLHGDGTYYPRSKMPGGINGWLQDVKVDIESHFTRKKNTTQNLADSRDLTSEQEKEVGEKLQATSETPKDDIRDKVFIGYSHKDERWLNDLQIHLKPYVRNGSVTAWSDKQIAPGSKWFPEIEAALASTKVAVLLVTQHFLASDFIHEHEMGPLLKEAEKGNVSIIWVPVRASAYTETSLKDYLSAGEPDKPLANMRKADRDKAWVRICEEIKKAVSR